MSQAKTSSPTKDQLQIALSEHEEALKQEIDSFSQETKNIITNAVFVGGTLIGAYLIVSRLVDAGRKQKGDMYSEKNTEKGKDAVARIVSQATEAIANQAIVMLLGLAKEKMSEYLQSKNAKHENTDCTAAKTPAK